MVYGSFSAGNQSSPVCESLKSDHLILLYGQKLSFLAIPFVLGFVAMITALSHPTPNPALKIVSKK